MTLLKIAPTAFNASDIIAFNLAFERFAKDFAFYTIFSTQTIIFIITIRYKVILQTKKHLLFKFIYFTITAFNR